MDLERLKGGQNVGVLKTLNLKPIFWDSTIFFFFVENIDGILEKPYINNVDWVYIESIQTYLGYIF
jgi:hypothetical protein